MEYVLSSSSVLSFVALHLKNSGKEVTVITYSDPVIQYCREADIKYIPFKPKIPSFSLSKNPFKIIKRVISATSATLLLKKRLDEFIEKINFGKDDGFHLLTRWISIANFYLAKELAKNGIGTVYFSGIRWQEPRIYNPKFKRVYFERLLIKLLFKMILGLDLVFFESNNLPRFGIDDNFFHKYNIENVSDKVRYVEFVLGVVENSDIGQHQYDYLLIGEGPGLLERIKLESITEVYDFLFNLPINIVVKKHPRMKGPETQVGEFYQSYFENCVELPKYFAAELLLKNVQNSVISVSSTPLVIASQMEHLKAVSLLELVDWYHDTHKQAFRRDLARMSDNKVIFVRNFTELKEVLFRN